jgi:general stress protein 26
MSTEHDLEAKFWKALKSDMTMMLGLDGVDDGHTRPMTAQFEDNRSPVWFFTSKDNALVAALGGGTSRAIASFTAKDHDLFATVHGRLTIDTDRAVIDRLWNAFIAAWYKGGKDDPDLVLLRLDAERAEIWLNESNILAGIKMLLGADPRADYKDKVAEVNLG